MHSILLYVLKWSNNEEAEGRECVYSHMHRISHKTYTNWERGSMEGRRPHFLPSYGLILQVLKTNTNIKHALRKIE